MSDMSAHYLQPVVIMKLCCKRSWKNQSTVPLYTMSGIVNFENECQAHKTKFEYFRSEFSVLV